LPASLNKNFFDSLKQETISIRIWLMKNSNHIFTTILLALGFLALSPTPKAFGVVPPPDGGYPGFTTAEGTNALKNLTTGSGNTGVGWLSLFTASTANFNTGVGAGTLTLNTGDNNTAMGAVALFLNTTGANNTAVGMAALLNNDTGQSNTAVGGDALLQNVTGNFNTAIGQGTLTNNDADGNTAVGTFALHDNTVGSENTAIGQQALAQGVNDHMNTAVGFHALFNNIDGQANTAVGHEALNNNTGGDSNVGIGGSALFNSTGTQNVALGPGAGFNVFAASNVIAIGNPGQDLSNSCYIGNIFGQPVAGGSGTQVFVDANGKLGTILSSRRFKRDIKPMDKTSEAILALKPVAFRYKSDAKNTPSFGLIAEEVAEVNPDLVVRDKNSEILSVRYDQVNAMLLNEFLKEHKKVQNLEATVAQQQKSFQSKLAEQDRQIEALASGLQKVSAQVEVRTPGPQVVKAP
jgi:hypothetical protein